MKESCFKALYVIFVLGLLSCTSGQDDDPLAPDSPLTPDGQITSATVQGYQLEIYTPKNYTTLKQYPVVYFNDGQSLFNGGWELDATLNTLIAAETIEEIIVVAIHSDNNRTLNYTPYDDPWMAANWGLTAPLAAEYSLDVVNQIVPFIDQNFSTIKNKSSRAFMGASLGGLQATWAVSNHSDTFSMIGAFSPSFWAGDYAIFDEDFTKDKDLKIWFDMGTAEWNYYVPLQSKLISEGYAYGEDVFYFEVPGGTHSVSAWKARVQYPLIAFFSKNQDYTPSAMEVHTEVIPSQSRPGSFFLRINPIVTTANGIQYSLAEAANYNLENTDAGTILSDGRFSFSKEENLTVTIQYKGLEQQHVINYQEVKSLTGG